jgi:hypothetical protein
MPEVPSKTSLDAHADQHLAAARDLRAELAEACGGDDLLLTLGDALAVILREQFPGVRKLGRITLAVAVSLESIRAAGESGDRPVSRLELSAVAVLAAERLEREEAGRG